MRSKDDDVGIEGQEIVDDRLVVDAGANDVFSKIGTEITITHIFLLRHPPSHVFFQEQHGVQLFSINTSKV